MRAKNPIFLPTLAVTFVKKIDSVNSAYKNLFVSSENQKMKATFSFKCAQRAVDPVSAGLSFHYVHFVPNWLR